LLTAVALLLAGVAWLEDGPARRMGAAGLLALGVGVAASTVPAVAPRPPAFLAVNAGLLGVGIAVCLAALALGGWRARGAGLIGPLAGGAGGLLVAVEVGRSVAQAGVGRGLVVAMVVAAVGAGWAWLRRAVLDDVIRRREPPHAPASAARWPGLLVLVLGALAVGAGGHIGGLLVGAAASAWGAWLALPRSARPRPYAPVLVLALLGAALWLLGTIAGPEGLALSAIPSLPLSPAAERLAALLLAGAAWILSGLWPWRHPADGALTAPIAVWLLLRLGLPAVPAGLEHWRPALFPLLVVGIWYAALTRRTSPLAVGGALLGVASLDPVGIAGAGWLLASAIALELWQLRGRADASAAAPLVRAGLALLAGWGALGALTGGLRTEVVYTVLAAAGAAAGLAGGPRSAGAPAAPVALTPPPAGSIFGRETR
jgi:hypothetical protein